MQHQYIGYLFQSQQQHSYPKVLTKIYTNGTKLQQRLYCSGCLYNFLYKQEMKNGLQKQIIIKLIFIRHIIANLSNLQIIYKMNQTPFINLCKPQHYFNISQRYSFIVYDYSIKQELKYKGHQLKNSIKIDSHSLDALTITQTSQLERFIIYPEQVNEREQLKQLYFQRKRIYNFFTLFNESDEFSTYLETHITNQNKDQNVADNFKFTVEELKVILNAFIAPDEDQQTRSQNVIGMQNIKVFQLLLSVIEVFQKERFREINILYKPNNIMFQQYPLLDYSIPRNQLFLNKSLPNEIIQFKLYLGSAEHAKNSELLVRQLGITHVVNTANEVKNYVGQLQYLNIRIEDEITESIQLYFDQVYEYIDKIWEQAEFRILVHCAQGRSRSATMVIMFLMRKFNWSLQTASTYVQERREIVSVNDGFLKQLELYEKQINNS